MLLTHEKTSCHFSGSGALGRTGGSAPMEARARSVSQKGRRQEDRGQGSVVSFPATRSRLVLYRQGGSFGDREASSAPSPGRFRLLPRGAAC